MSAPISRIFDLAQATLDAIVTRWPADATALPLRQYIHTGAPAADDEQVVVWVPRTIGTQQANVGRQGIEGWPDAITGMRTVVIQAQILRNVPTVRGEGGENIELPKVGELTDAARMLLYDAQAVLNCILEAQDDKMLAGFGNLAFDVWEAIDASGGLSGGQQRFRLGAW